MATLDPNIKEEDMKKDDFLFRLLTDNTFTTEQVDKILTQLKTEETKTPANLSTIITIQHKMYVLANYDKDDKDHTIIQDRSRVNLIEFVFNTQFTQYVKQITEITERIKNNAVYFNNAALGKKNGYIYNKIFSDKNPVRVITKEVDKAEDKAKKEKDKLADKLAEEERKRAAAAAKTAKETAAAAERDKLAEEIRVTKEKLDARTDQIEKEKIKRKRTNDYKNTLTQFYLNKVTINPYPEKSELQNKKMLYIITLDENTLDYKTIILDGKGVGVKRLGHPLLIMTEFSGKTIDDKGKPIGDDETYLRESISPYDAKMETGLKDIRTALTGSDEDNKQVAKTVIAEFLKKIDETDIEINSVKEFNEKLIKANKAYTELNNEVKQFSKRINSKSRTDKKTLQDDIDDFEALFQQTDDIITDQIYVLYNSLKTIKGLTQKQVKPLFTEINKLQENVDIMYNTLFQLDIKFIRDSKGVLEAKPLVELKDELNRLQRREKMAQQEPPPTAAEAVEADAEAKRAAWELAEARDAKADNEKIFAEAKARSEAKEAEKKRAAEVELSNPQLLPQSQPMPPQPSVQPPDISVKSSFEEIKTDMEAVTNIEEIKLKLQELDTSLDELILQSPQETDKISEKLKEYLEILKILNNKILEARTIKITAYYLTNRGESGFNSSSIQPIIQMYDTFFAEFKAIHERYLMNYVNAFSFSEDKNLFLNLLKDMYKEIAYQDAARASIAYDMIKDIEPDSNRKQLATSANDKVIKYLAEILPYVVAKPDSISPTLTDQVREIFSSLEKFFVETDIVVSAIALIKFLNNKDQGKAIINELMEEVSEENEKLKEIIQQEAAAAPDGNSDGNSDANQVAADLAGAATVDEEEDDLAAAEAAAAEAAAAEAAAAEAAAAEAAAAEAAAAEAAAAEAAAAEAAAAEAAAAEAAAAEAAAAEAAAAEAAAAEAAAAEAAAAEAAAAEAAAAEAAAAEAAAAEAAAAEAADGPEAAAAKSNHPSVADNIKSMNDNVDKILVQIHEMYDDTKRKYDSTSGANAGVKDNDARFMSVNTFMQKYEATKISIEAITPGADKTFFSDDLGEITKKLDTLRPGDPMSPKAKFDFITTKLGQRVITPAVPKIDRSLFNWWGDPGLPSVREAIPNDTDTAASQVDQPKINTNSGGTRGGRTRRGRKRFHKKTFKKKRFNRKTFKKKRFNRNTGNKKTFKKKTGNTKTGNTKTSINKRVNNKTGNNKRVNNKTGNNKRVNKTGNNKRVNNKTGNNKRVNKKIVNNKTIHKNHFKRKQTHKNN
jgi:chemotaxis protein histidine kinase CheA